MRRRQPAQARYHGSAATHVDDVQERLQEACDTLRRLLFPRDGAPSTKIASSPNVVQDYWTAYARSEAKVTRVRPTMAEIDRMDVVLPWFYLIDGKLERRVVWLRSVPLGLRKVGRILGVSHEHVRELEGRAMRTLVERLGAPGRLGPGGGRYHCAGQ